MEEAGQAAIAEVLNRAKAETEEPAVAAGDEAAAELLVCFDDFDLLEVTSFMVASVSAASFPSIVIILTGCTDRCGSRVMMHASFVVVPHTMKYT